VRVEVGNRSRNSGLRGCKVLRRLVHTACLHHRDKDAHIMQFQAAFNAFDLVHGGTPDIEMDIRQSDNSIMGAQRRRISFKDIGVSLVACRREETAMKLSRRKCLHLAAGGAVVLPVGSRIAWAQVYPTRPITMVVPYAAGGPADTVGRVLAERMRVSLGQPVIIENVGGANGSIAVGRVAHAAPDGYTLSLGLWNTHVSNGALYALPSDVLTDFEPVSLLASFSSMIVVRKAMPANNLKEFIAWLKANPSKASQGSAGVGSMGHLGGVYFQNITGTRIQHVPYRGSAPAMQDLVAGQVDVMIDAPVVILPQLHAGTIKAFAVLAKGRLAQATDVPTADEAGLPGFHVSNWFGFWVPRGTAKDIIGKLNAAAVSSLADPTVRQKFADLGFEIPPRGQQTSEALGAFQKAEIDKWWPIIRAANIKGE
jgi:tripartite-type tricarboxylate transporter receptor subunit TctC